MESLKKRVDEVYKEWLDYKVRSKQRDILYKDSLVKKAYNDLYINWNERHADFFIYAVEKFIKQ